MCNKNKRKPANMVLVVLPSSSGVRAGPAAIIVLSRVQGIPGNLTYITRNHMRRCYTYDYYSSITYSTMLNACLSVCTHVFSALCPGKASTLCMAEQQTMCILNRQNIKMDMNNKDPQHFLIRIFFICDKESKLSFCY